MDDITRLRYSKFVGNGSALIAIFYIILAGSTYSLSLTILPGWYYAQIVYLPILVGFTSILWAIFNFSFDKKSPWVFGTKISLFIILGSITLIVGQILVMVSEIFGNIIAIIATGVMIISCILISIGFLFLHKQLLSFYLNQFISKKTNLFAFYGFCTQALAYLIYFISWFLLSPALDRIRQIINILGMIVSAISVILIMIGSIKIHVIFRSFQELIMIQIKESL
ncbi:MAG: hypothetical protein ACTSSG_09720 [Candidatus Heimdallarchaeaceae archaeon]